MQDLNLRPLREIQATNLGWQMVIGQFECPPEHKSCNKKYVHSFGFKIVPAGISQSEIKADERTLMRFVSVIQSLGIEEIKQLLT